MKKSRALKRGCSQGLIVACVGAMLLGLCGCSRTKAPETVLLEDFQRPLDRDLTAQLEIVLKTRASQWIDSSLIKPYLDDVSTANLVVSAVELRAGQFPDRPELARVVADCARVLKMPAPRVFVSGSLDRPAIVVGIAEPKIVLSSSVLRRLDNEREVRFIIGRQLGHIRARHMRWQMIVHGGIGTARRMMLVPDELALAPLLPLFKWAREAEMTADNAGLICAQDLRAAEQALLRTELDIEENIAVDIFLVQNELTDTSKFSETMLYWKELARPQPFLAERVKQLRAYAESVQYRHLWE
jgi:Zn-dependent protease with chaperone function